MAGEPFRAIASLEMLATLAGIVCFGLGSDESGSVVCSAATDNLGSVCVMGQLEWAPRLQNREADSLTNGDFWFRQARLSLESFDGRRSVWCHTSQACSPRMQKRKQPKATPTESTLPRPSGPSMAAKARALQRQSSTAQALK